MSKKIIKLKQSDLVKQVKKIIQEQNEGGMDVSSIFQKHGLSSIEEVSQGEHNDEFEFGDEVISVIINKATQDGDITDDQSFDLENELKDQFGDEILDSFGGEMDLNEQDTGTPMILKVGKDENGKYYVIDDNDPNNPKIIAITN